MPLRNFGLSFSRQDARPDAGVSWRPRHTAAISCVLVLVLLAALWAWLAHAASEDQTTAQRMITRAWPALSRPLASRPLCKASRWESARVVPQWRTVSHRAYVTT